MPVSSNEALEILTYLKTKLEIPDNIKALSIHFDVDDFVTIDCSYYPKLIPEDEETE